MSGEMAKLVVQNSLFGGNWKLSGLVIPVVMYMEPEYVTVGIYSAKMAQEQGIKSCGSIVYGAQQPCHFGGFECRLLQKKVQTRLLGVPLSQNDEIS